MKTSFGIAAAALCATLILAPAMASATAQDEYLGKTEAEIAASLQQDGYQVRRIKPEDGRLEAYAMRDGKKLEIYVDPATGKVVDIRQDD